MWVRIQNFQSIRDISFEVEGLTTFIGESSIGKSAIFRAIFYPFHAQLGDKFVRKGADFASVEIRDEDFHMLWEKGPDINRYTFGDKDLPKVTAGDIPLPILQAGFRDILLGRDKKTKLSAQFAAQAHGDLYLIDDNPSQVAEVFAKFSRLDVLMKASKNVDLDLTRTSRLLKVREGDVGRLEGRVASFEGVEETSSQIEELQVLGLRVKESTQQVQKVKSISNTLAEAVRHLSPLLPILTLVPASCPQKDPLLCWQQVRSFSERLSRALGLCRGLHPVVGLTQPPLPNPNLLYRVSELRSSLVEVRRRLLKPAPLAPTVPDNGRWVEVRRVAEKWKEIGVAQELPPSPSLPSLGSVGVIRSLVSKLVGLNSEIESLEVKIVEAQEEKRSLHGSLESLRQELKVCPLCEREFPHEVHS